VAIEGRALILTYERRMALVCVQRELFAGIRGLSIL
jgi:hypothetical protein